MQLTVEINMEQLIQIIKNLPLDQKVKIKSELDDMMIKKKKQEGVEFQKFLLKGPVMTGSQYQQFKENRKKMNQWRNM